MKELISNKYLTLILRVILGVVFCYAAIDKIIHIDQFARAIYYYHFLPGSLVNLLAIFMPMVEMVAGICLIVGLWPRGAVTLIAIMLVMFLIALSSVVARGIDISCGCFTVTNTGKSDVVALLWRDLLMLLACVQIYFFGKDLLSIHKLRD